MPRAPAPASRAAAALVGATITPASRSVASWRRGVLRVAVGAAHVRDHRHPLREPRERRRQPARGVGVRAVADHDVEQHAADVVAGRCSSIPSRTSRSTIGCGRPCVYSSSPRSKIAWPSSPPSPALPPIAPSAGRGSSPPRAPASRRSRGRAARPPRALRVDRGLELVDRGRARRPPPRTRPRRASGGSRTAPRRRPSRRTRRRRACRRRRSRPAAATTSRAGGLETSSSVSVPSSAASIRIASPNMIPPTSAERSRPPTPTICETPTLGAVEQARGLLRAGAGGGDDPDRARAHDVREAEPDLAEHRRAAARAHHQQPELRAAALELDLVGARRRGRRRGRRACPRSARGAPRASRTRRGSRSARRWRRERGGAQRARRLGAGAVGRRAAARSSSRSAPSSARLRRPSTAITTSVGPASAVHAERGQRLEVRGRAHRHLGAHAVAARRLLARPSSAARCRRSGCG